MLRYLISTILAFLTFGILLVINYFPIWYIFLPAVIFWFGVMFGIAHIFARKDKNIYKKLPILFSVSVAILVLLFLVEFFWIRIFLIGLNSVLVFFLFEIMFSRDPVLAYEQKPYRRIFMMMWVFCLYSGLTLLFALSMFFSNLNFFLLLIIFSALPVFVTFKIWSLYFDNVLEKYKIFLVVVWLFSFEVLWVFHYLPLGYFALSVLFVWLWYVIQLLARFYITKRMALERASCVLFSMFAAE